MPDSTATAPGTVTERTFTRSFSNISAVRLASSSSAFSFIPAVRSASRISVNSATPFSAAESFAAALKRFYPSSLWDSLDFDGFLSFWLLRYADLEQPSQCYASYRSQLDALIEKKEAERSAQRSDRSLGKQIARLKQQRELLQLDEQSLREHIEAIEVSDALIASISL